MQAWHAYLSECRGQHINGRVWSRPCHWELMYVFFDPLSHGSDLTLQSQVIHLVFITCEQWWGSTQCKVDSMAALVQTVPACLTIQSELSKVPQFQCFLQHVALTVPHLGSPGNKLDSQADLHSLSHTFWVISSFCSIAFHQTTSLTLCSFCPLLVPSIDLYSILEIYFHFSSIFSPFLLILFYVKCHASGCVSWLTFTSRLMVNMHCHSIFFTYSLALWALPVATRFHVYQLTLNHLE